MPPSPTRRRISYLPSTTWPSIEPGAYTIHDEPGAPQTSPPSPSSDTPAAGSNPPSGRGKGKPSWREAALDLVLAALALAVALVTPTGAELARIPLGTLAVLHVGAACAARARPAAYPLARRSIGVVAVAWLVVGGFQLASLAVTAHACDRLDRALAGALGIGAAVLVATGLPGVVLREPDRRGAATARFPKTGLAVLVALAGLRLHMVDRSARGQAGLAGYDVEVLIASLSTEPVLDTLPRAPRGVVDTLRSHEPVTCARPPGEAPTVFVRYLAREHSPAPVAVSCVQSETESSLADALRAELTKKAARGPLSLRLVVRRAELPASAMNAAVSLAPGRDAVCSGNVCLMPEQLTALGAHPTTALPGLGTYSFGAAPATLLGWLEPRRRGSRDAPLHRLETLELVMTIDGRLTRPTSDLASP